MKTRKYFPTALGFVTGTIFGLSVFFLLSFTRVAPSPSPDSSSNAISAAVAHSYFNNYMSGAVAASGVIKGFAIDKSQVDAINSLSTETPGLTAFRIYFGKDNNGGKIGIVVGVDNLGNDLVKNSIYGTPAQKFSPCPPICDVSSPIIFGN
ncbi:MAG: hypothetical protein WCO44_13955 [Bacteroidota bacterium]